MAHNYLLNNIHSPLNQTSPLLRKIKWSFHRPYFSFLEVPGLVAQIFTLAYMKTKVQGIAEENSREKKKDIYEFWISQRCPQNIFLFLCRKERK